MLEDAQRLPAADALEVCFDAVAVHTFMIAWSGGKCTPNRPSSPERLWCKTTNAEDDGSMQRFAPLEELFKGRHFDQEIVVQCVSWYLSFKLSYRDLVAMMA